MRTIDPGIQSLTPSENELLFLAFSPVHTSKIHLNTSFTYINRLPEFLNFDNYIIFPEKKKKVAVQANIPLIET